MTRLELWVEMSLFAVVYQLCRALVGRPFKGDDILQVVAGSGTTLWACHVLVH